MSKTADLRNIATIERLAKEVLKQCAHYRRNCEVGDDSLRFLHIQIYANDLQKWASQGARRALAKR